MNSTLVRLPPLARCVYLLYTPCHPLPGVYTCSPLLVTPYQVCIPALHPLSPLARCVYCNVVVISESKWLAKIKV
ncbi:hypothetical protein EB796_015798 [Bugula neritina]|uniref:Uncharacterized protein n=1 Tax=Bugula neritina TaxID=10212 RepID=A0A7J7JK96_BUGNE|nr:hypothetical protein EB796_015798 [Bugula neritina]